MERHPSSRIIEYNLFMKLLKYKKKYMGLRENKTIDVFNRLLYIGPEDINIVNFIKKKPVAIFNPGIVLKKNKLIVFPRIVIGYYHYLSAIGVFEIDIDDILGGGKLDRPINVEIILYPTESWEQALGCEDPRVVYEDNKYIMLYTAVDYSKENVGERPQIGLSKLYSLQALAFLDNEFNVIERKYFKIKGFGRYHVPIAWKDSALLGKGISRVMLTRPKVLGREIGWSCRVDLAKAEAYLESFKPILYNEPWERKVGWSTNAIEISPGEYLVGWHGVSVVDGIYRSGFMVVDREGNPLMISKHYLLEPRNINELYGDRPGVIFGDGLIKYHELLLWVGGVADHAIGFYVTEINNVLEHMKPIRLGRE